MLKLLEEEDEEEEMGEEVASRFKRLWCGCPNDKFYADRLIGGVRCACDLCTWNAYAKLEFD